MDDEIGASPEVRYAYHKFLYDQGLTLNAIQRLRRLVKETAEPLTRLESRSSLTGSELTTAEEPESTTVKVRMRLRLAQWELDESHKNLNQHVVADITGIIRECSQFNQEDLKAFHEIAMLHMTCAEYYHTLSTPEAHDQVTNHLEMAISNFFDAISLSKDKNSSLVLQDILRLITLWFTYGNREEVINAINRGFNIISLDTGSMSFPSWLLVSTLMRVVQSVFSSTSSFS